MFICCVTSDIPVGRCSAVNMYKIEKEAVIPNLPVKNRIVISVVQSVQNTNGGILRYGYTTDLCLLYVPCGAKPPAMQVKPHSSKVPARE